MRRRVRECEEVRALLSDYVDDELEPQDRRRIDEHVGFCPRCRTALANLRLTLDRLRGLSKKPPQDARDAEAAVERIRTSWRDRA